MRKALIFIVLFSLIIGLCGFATAPPSPKLYQVERVIDGDTIKLSNGERVRYIGIDTPERGGKSSGEEAYYANKRLVDGKKVRLEFDVQKRDDYRRLLAYVYIDDIFVNAWLVENGYARVATFPPNVKYEKLFLKLVPGTDEVQLDSSGRGGVELR